jgi:aldehyde:ferredoxin oxidoreductase
MPYGYNGKILHVSLASGEFRVETPEPEFYRKYLGGSALNTYYLLKMVPVGADPLGQENVLVVSVGVTTGASIAGQSRVNISAKSPLTGLVGDSQAGGYFPAEMKFAGYDAFIFTGKSPKPVYLWVDDGKYELRDASHLWGRITGEVEDLIQEELGGEKIRIVQIGPAGEKLVKFASVINNCNRANARTGVGAVMGSKNLKAIAVRGKQGKKNYTVARPEEFKKISREGPARLKDSFLKVLGKYGTAISMFPQSVTGQLPTYNYSSGTYSDVEKISGEALYNTALRGAKEGKQDSQGRDTCYACPIRCKRVVEINDGDIKVEPRYGGPEYETMAMIGSDCGINNLAAIAKANELCNKYGMDTISCGATVAWAMECFEKGIITKDDTGGIELRFGNVPAYLEVFELIGKREGFGDVLAEGSVRASRKIGRGSENLTVTSNKHEFPAHMPRVKVSLGVNYATNPYGACHMTAGHDPQYEQTASDNADEAPQPVSPALSMLGLNNPTAPRSLGPEKMRYLRITEDYQSAIDSLSWCLFVSGATGGLYLPDEMPEIINHVTGWDMTLEEFLRVGERKFNMMRLFNARDGYTKSKDQLPNKMFIPLEGGVSDGIKLDKEEWENAKLEFYRQRGWDETTGNPTSQKIAELGLEWAVL